MVQKELCSVIGYCVTKPLSPPTSKFHNSDLASKCKGDTLKYLPRSDANADTGIEFTV